MPWLSSCLFAILINYIHLSFIVEYRHRTWRFTVYHNRILFSAYYCIHAKARCEFVHFLIHLKILL